MYRSAEAKKLQLQAEVISMLDHYAKLVTGPIHDELNRWFRHGHFVSGNTRNSQTKLINLEVIDDYKEDRVLIVFKTATAIGQIPVAASLQLAEILTQVKWNYYAAINAAYRSL